MVKKIIICFGTRPEAIKLAPLIKILKSKFEVIVCVTGQHRNMLDQALSLFDIHVDFDLKIMKKNQDLFHITSKIILGMKKILIKQCPDIVLVHGDTTTTMAASLASFYLKIPIGHIEAGLRTNDIYSPYPEEFNRSVVSKVAALHFAPTKHTKQNLLKENISSNKIFVTGNTVIDALLLTVKKAREIQFEKNLIDKIPFLHPNHKSKTKIILVTGHRRENFGSGFENICKSLKKIAFHFPSVNIIYPVHLNPNVKDPVQRILSNIGNIYLIDPLDYLSFIKLMDLSYLIMTDSGGIQEEAPSLNKPVLVLREKTERPEAIDAGTARIVGTKIKNIVKEVRKILSDEREYKEMISKKNPYGDGKASLKILKVLEDNRI